MSDISSKIDEIIGDGGSVDFAMRWDRRIHSDSMIEFHQRHIDALLRAEQPKDRDGFVRLLKAYTKGLVGVWIACGEDEVRKLVKEAADEDEKDDDADGDNEE